MDIYFNKTQRSLISIVENIMYIMIKKPKPYTYLLSEPNKFCFKTRDIANTLYPIESTLYIVINDIVKKFTIVSSSLIANFNNVAEINNNIKFVEDVKEFILDSDYICLWMILYILVQMIILVML